MYMWARCLIIKLFLCLINYSLEKIRKEPHTINLLSSSTFKK